MALGEEHNGQLTEIKVELARLTQGFADFRALVNERFASAAATRDTQFNAIRDHMEREAQLFVDTTTTLRTSINGHEEFISGTATDGSDGARARIGKLESYERTRRKHLVVFGTLAATAFMKFVYDLALLAMEALASQGGTAGPGL